MQTIFESIAQTSTSIVQTISESTTQIPIPIIKPQTKTSWIWNYYIKKLNKKGEMHAYYQFVMDNREKCIKNYKYDGSIGNLSYHTIKHGIILSTEIIISEI